MYSQIIPKFDDNKYSRGKCNIIAGCSKYPGAAILCAKASEKSGSGYTQVYTHKKHVKEIAVSLVTCPTSSFDNINYQNNKKTKPLSYVIGPGFDNGEYVGDLISSTDAPVVIDGGALKAFSSTKNQKKLINRKAPTILTPHMGEAKNLAKYFNSDVNSQNLSLSTGCIIVLKGPVTNISQNLISYKMVDGTPQLATAGTGDVLAGILGALLLKMSPFAACVLGTNIHALAGKIAAKKKGPISVSAMDVIHALPQAFSEFLDKPFARQ